HYFFCYWAPRHPNSTLFPYTTLFRSEKGTASEEMLAEIRSQVDREVAEAADRAMGATKPGPETVRLHVYSEEVDPRSSAFDTERSEEHTSELQSLRHLVCRLLLEKKK